MRALTLWQPWAQLVALGVKVIETRSWGTKYRGPLLIHAAARKPTVPGAHGWIGRYNLGQWADPVQHADPCDCDHDEEQLGDRCAKTSGAQPALLNDEGAHGFSLATVLPLGAAVAVADLFDCLPMVRCHGRPGDDPVRHLSIDDHLGLMVCRDWQQLDATAQQPYGDFQPGRWAWLLQDIRPLPEPIPCTGRQGLWTPNQALADLLPAVTLAPEV